ncbi:unnamed protein product [Dovyalis caffra]|uniref:AP2/ERF domain-containing protein n=1 Tax=Dovyalis caffra TaxID=77055 RepID=A0AAV1RYC3_9ROSI|nr:unnamed protein product [Dovyalis caffra]
MLSNNPSWGQTSQNQRVVAANATSHVTIYEEVQYGRRTFSEYQGADRFYEEVQYGRRCSEYQGACRFYEEIPYGRRTSEYQGADRSKEQRRCVAYAFNNGILIPNQPSGIVISGKQEAAITHDLASLKFSVSSAQLNFPQIPNHAKEVGAMGQMTGQDVANFNRSRNSFVRGKSRFHGVARHHDTGKWQAWTATGETILGIFETEEEAAIAFDLACIKQKGYQAITNYDIRHYDVNAMLNGNKPKLQGVEVEKTWPVTAQMQAYPHITNTNNAGWNINIQPRIYRARGFRLPREGLTNFVEILGLEKQDNGSGLRFRHGDSSAFNLYQEQIIKPAVRHAGFGIGHATASSYQFYKQTESGDHQDSSFAPLQPQNRWLFPPYSINVQREQRLKAAGVGFKHSIPSRFKVYKRNTMWKGKVKVNF